MSSKTNEFFFILPFSLRFCVCSFERLVLMDVQQIENKIMTFLKLKSKFKIFLKNESDFVFFFGF